MNRTEEIRALLAYYNRMEWASVVMPRYKQDVGDLLAEVDRLESEVEILKADAEISEAIEIMLREDIASLKNTTRG